MSVTTDFPVQLLRRFDFLPSVQSQIIVLSSPETNTASKPRSEAVITGAAETWMTSTSLAIKRR